MTNLSVSYKRYFSWARSAITFKNWNEKYLFSQAFRLKLERLGDLLILAIVFVATGMYYASGDQEPELPENDNLNILTDFDEPPK